MEYVSTRNSKVKFSFKDVFLNGLAADGGLYVPCKIPYYSEEDIKNYPTKNLQLKLFQIFAIRTLVFQK